MPGVPDYTGVPAWITELQRVSSLIGRIQTIYQMAVELDTLKQQYLEVDGSSNPVYPVTVAAINTVFLADNITDMFDVIDILHIYVVSWASTYADLLAVPPS